MFICSHIKHFTLAAQDKFRLAEQRDTFGEDTLAVKLMTRWPELACVWQIRSNYTSRHVLMQMKHDGSPIISIKGTPKYRCCAIII
jgi:hypothetical protein